MRDPLGDTTGMVQRPSFRPRLVFLVTWFVAGGGAVAGSILAHNLGHSGLFAGAIVGGLLGVGGGTATLVRIGWLPRELRWGVLWGGVVGFLVAAPIAVANLHTPITPLVSCALAGLGALLGAGVARRK